MRKELPIEEEVIQKLIKDAEESIPDEDEPKEEVFEEGFDVSEEEAEKGFAEVQKRMDEENPER